MADAYALDRAAALLRAGQLVIFPTETVYGVGARADDNEAVARLRAAKRRPAEQPFVVMVPHTEAAESLVRISPQARRLMARYWPGPLTLVLPAAKGGTIALRIPDHPVALALLARVAFALVTSSANRAGERPPTDALGALAALPLDVSVVLDGGPCRVGKPSTILDLTAPQPRILREGVIARSELIP